MFISINASALAQDDTFRAAFYETIDDIPVLTGLLELTDNSVVYDKPQGRYIQMVLFSDSLPAERIKSFFAASLPQLGWAPSKNLDQTIHFTRGKEQLRLDLSTYHQDQTITFTLSPA